MLTLYLAPGSSSMAVHIALREIGAPFEARTMSFHKHDMRAPAFLAINPAGKVPTLLVDGRPLTEVAGCLFYLAKRFPAAALLPANDIEAEAQAVSWMSFIASTIHPVARLGGEAVAQAWAVAERKFGDRAKDGGDWALGRYSIVDIHLFRLYWRMKHRANPASGFPRLDALYDRMMARPAVQRTIEAETAIGYELPA